MVGDHTHIFWDCPKIQTFWKNIKGEMERILEKDIPLDPLLFLLDVLPDHWFTTDECYILHILLMTARKTITMNWMKLKPPTTVKWLQKVKHVYMMECMTAQLQLKLPIFKRRWASVTDYLKLVNLFLKILLMNNFLCMYVHVCMHMCNMYVCMGRYVCMRMEGVYMGGCVPSVVVW